MRFLALYARDFYGFGRFPQQMMRITSHERKIIKIANEKRASHKMTTTTTIVSQTAANDSKNLASIVNAFLTQP